MQTARNVARSGRVVLVFSFEHYAVLSIEKSRTGQTGGDVEFYKHFDQSRFEPDGRVVTEQLVDERIYTE